jgi:hypothetical protein
MKLKTHSPKAPLKALSNENDIHPTTENLMTKKKYESNLFQRNM